MSDEPRIFAEHADLMRQAADLLDARAASIKPQPGRGSEWYTPAEWEVEIPIRICIQRSLKVFADTLRFLADDILVEQPPQRSFFLLPHARTLLDVYARLLHLQANCPDRNLAALTCIAYQLLTYASVRVGQDYGVALAQYATFLSSQHQVTFPANPSEMDHEWIRDHKLGFASRKKVLTKTTICEHSAYATEVFGTKGTYETYAHLSEFLHGNPYYYTGKPHNERYWIVAVSISTSAFLMELVDKYTLRKVRPRDFTTWLAQVKKQKVGFTRLWFSKSAAR